MMKRLWIVCMAVVMLVLTACAPIVQPESTTAPPETTAAPVETTAPEETTAAPVETTIPEETTAPTQETTLSTQPLFPPDPEPELDTVDAEEEYGYSFVYHIGEDPADGYYEYYLQLDVSQCEDGYLYRYNRHTKELIRVLDEQVAIAVPCGFGYLYVPETNRQIIMWADAYGDNSIPVYTAQYGEIFSVQWYPYKSNSSSIYILEDDSHILELSDLDFPPNILYEGEDITSFSAAAEDYLSISFKGTEWYWHLHNDSDSLIPKCTCTDQP